MIKYCIVCGKEIPIERSKVLPDITTCVEHSDTKKKSGLKIVADDVTYTDLEIDKIYRGGIN